MPCCPLTLNANWPGRPPAPSALSSGFRAEDLAALNAPPLFEGVPVERDGTAAVAFRWLGGGRGEPYVQPEIGATGDVVTVYGGFSHREFGPWLYRPKDQA